MQAKKIETYRDKYFSTVVYEYRGKQYEVTYPNGMDVCCSPAWVQHRDAQEKIDMELDAPQSDNGEPFDLDEVFEMLGWD